MCKWYHIDSGKLLREKTFANFVVLCLFAKVFSAKFGGVASFGVAQASNPRKISPRKSYFSPIHESFLLYGISSPAAYTVCASPAWLGSLRPGEMSATTVVSWTRRIWPLPGRGLKPWPPRRTKFRFLLVRRPRSRTCPSSHGAVGVRSTSWCGVSVVRLSVGALVMRSPTKGKYWQ